MAITPTRNAREDAALTASSSRSGSWLATVLSLLATSAMLVFIVAAVIRPDTAHGKTFTEPSHATSFAELAPPPPGPPSCNATAQQSTLSVPDSQAIPISLRIECDRTGSLVVTPPGGTPVGTELDTSGHFEGVLGHAYTCAGSIVTVSAVVTDESGQRWQREVPLLGNVSAPNCDLLIRPGVTELDWEHRTISITDAFSADTLGTPSGFGANDSTRALDHLSVWHLDKGSGRWSAWGVGAPRTFRKITTLEPGQHYLIASDAELTWDFPDSPLVSVLEAAQVISYYGHPGVAAMGMLGAGTPEQAADGIEELASRYDRLNGNRDVIPALHLITGVAQSQPGADGLHHTRMPDEQVSTWVELAHEREQLIFLDVQIGLANPLEEVRALEAFLRKPHVHLALDPEFATHGRGKPGISIGSLDSTTIDEVQNYLAEIVREDFLPPKLLVLHQFLDRMLPGSEGGYANHPEVEIVIDMDGYGPPHAKLTKYHRYALGGYAERSAIKLFFRWDAPLLSPADLQALANPPDLVIYQ